MRRQEKGIFADRDVRGYAPRELALGDPSHGHGMLAAARASKPLERTDRSRVLALGTQRNHATNGRHTGDGLAVRTKGIRMDHRLGARYRVFRLVELQFDDADRAGGLLYNISRNGMFVLTTAGFDVNRCVDVHIPSVNDGETVRISGLVVHRSNSGIGVIFRDLDSDAESVVEDFCAWR